MCILRTSDEEQLPFWYEVKCIYILHKLFIHGIFPEGSAVPVGGGVCGGGGLFVLSSVGLRLINKPMEISGVVLNRWQCFILMFHHNEQNPKLYHSCVTSQDTLIFVIMTNYVSNDSVGL